MVVTALQPWTCAEVAARISEHLDGELGTADEARLALHLAACRGCAAEAAALALTVRAIHRAAGWVGERPACRRR